MLLLTGCRGEAPPASHPPRGTNSVASWASPTRRGSVRLMQCARPGRARVNGIVEVDVHRGLTYGPGGVCSPSTRARCVPARRSSPADALRATAHTRTGCTLITDCAHRQSASRNTPAVHCCARHNPMWHWPRPGRGRPPNLSYNRQRAIAGRAGPAQLRGALVSAAIATRHDDRTMRPHFVNSRSEPDLLVLPDVPRRLESARPYRVEFSCAARHSVYGYTGPHSST